MIRRHGPHTGRSPRRHTGGNPGFNRAARIDISLGHCHSPSALQSSTRAGHDMTVPGSWSGRKVSLRVPFGSLPGRRRASILALASAKDENRFAFRHQSRLDPLVVRPPAFPAPQDADPEIAGAHPALGRIMDEPPQRCRIGPGRAIAHARPADAERAAAAPLAQPVRLSHLVHEVAALRARPAGWACRGSDQPRAA